jgi:hypothetical protein
MGVSLQKITVVGLCVFVLLAASIARSPSVSAAGECGSTYSYVTKYAIKVPNNTTNRKFGAPGNVTGYLELYRSSIASRFCVIARANSLTAGVKMFRYVDIFPGSSALPYRDAGMFANYAGPAYSAKVSVTSCINSYAAFGPYDETIDWGERAILRNC